MTERFIIYGRSSCAFCIHAADLCSAKKAEYLFLDYEEKREILEDYKQFYEQATVPIILVNNLDTGLTKKVGGYTDLLDYVK